MTEMTRKEANVFLAVILETVAETPEGAPEGVMYAALCGKLDLSGFQGLLTIASDVGLVTRSNHVATITDKGRDMVRKIQAARNT